MKILKNILFLFLLLPTSIISQNSNSTFVYQEEFNSKGTWPTGNNANRELSVYNGRYYFDYKKTEKSWRISTPAYNLNTNSNFEIETSIQKISGVDNYAISFLYDFKDDNNYKEFGITSGGFFRISEANNGTYSNIKAWTKSDKIKTGNFGVNVLKVSKTANTISFYVNNALVYSESYKNFIGNKTAIMLYRNQKISIDYIRVKQTGTTINNNTNYANNNNDYKTKTILYDSFYSNTNHWAVSSDNNVVLEINNGKYYFEYKGQKGFTTTKTLDLDTQKDFKIETSIQKISGIKNNGFGIIFGRKDGGNQFQFLITSSGSFAVDKYANNKLQTLQDWKASSAIKKENFSTNTIKLEKRGNDYVFFINNTEVYRAYNLNFPGNRYGFAVFQPQKIAIDYLNIAYLNNNSNNKNIYNINHAKEVESVLFADDFNNKTNHWTEQNDVNTHFRISNGKYYVAHKREKLGYSTNIKKYFDTSKDFEFVAKLDKISGANNSPFGFMWGLEGGNSFRFYIAGTGYYKIVRTVDGKEEIIEKWTKSSAVNQNNGASNILKVRKEGDHYKYFINDRYVTKTDFEPFYGDRLGFVVYNKQEIAVDYLRIHRLKNKNDNLQIVTRKDLSVPLTENFSSNANGWQLEDADDYSVALENRKLILHRKKKGGIFISRSIDINTQKDFVIETAISRITNSNSGLYGVTFGRKNSANEYSFLFSGNGSYMFRKFENNVYKKIIPFTETPAIKVGKDFSNKLKIVKSGGLLRFYINDQYVNETAFEPFFGNKLGYTIYHDKKIAIDYLKVNYQSASFNNPPVVVISEPNVELKRGFKIVEAKKILVRGTATDSDGIYEITINGVEANVSENGTFSANVPLKYGKNDLVVKATDMKQASSTKTFVVKRNSANINNGDVTENNNEKLDIGFGKYYALIIGVSTYQDKSIQDLQGKPIRDAQNLADVLVNNYTFAKENVTVLKNPTENQITREFYNLKKKVSKNDNVVIFYAGHGNYDKVSERGYWMPSDAEMEFEGNVILNTSIVSYIRAINSKHTLLIADACFSGSILTTSRSYKEASKAVQKKYALPSRKAITSGTLTTVPNESVFMKYLLKRLQQNNDKYLSAGQLFNMIEDPVINNTTGDNQPQYAPISRTGDEGGDFIFIKK
ncbi:caspase family protein [Polaribacter batillariae]|uniref:Caspase family protein n=1 Tax=Polaribacter batillariae TaxID=2808900 RepID=A0ABX7SYN4_9FLAO|nr:caspase family protein [Polaribacter batillariae]QTD37904.1 caspase family protein [Polaribacter batillariae]